MIHSLALHFVLGKPLFIWLGLLAFLSLLLTAFISISNLRLAFHPVPFSWHSRMAKITLFLAAVHVLMALSINLRF